MEHFGQPPLEEPPSDPDEWTDQQWIDWLNKTDAADAEDAGRPVVAMSRIAHSPGGSMLGQAMLGMANAIYGREDNEIAIVTEGGSQPDEDEPFSIHLDFEHPERSVVVFRSQRPPRPTGETGDDGLV